MAMPNAPKKFVHGLVKMVVAASCTSVMNRTIQSGRGTNISPKDRDVVVSQVCDVVKFTTDLLLDSDGTKTQSVDVGIFLVKQGVNVSNLSRNQQILCAAAITDLGINGYKAIKEYKDTISDTEFYYEVGLLGGPELAAAGVLIGAGSHAPQVVDKSTKLVKSAFEMHSQCGPLAFDKTTMPRTPDTPTETDLVPPENGPTPVLP